MAQRRMFSPKVTSTDAFLDMPVSARELYFQLGMNADDDGFITPRHIVRMTGATTDDLKVLISKNFVIPFESGVIVITAWKVNNLVRKDWYQETIYKDEKAQLETNSNGHYKLVNEMLTEVRLGKVNIPALPAPDIEEIRIVTPYEEEYEEKVAAKGYDIKDTNYLLNWAKDEKGARFSNLPFQRKKINEMLKAKWNVKEIIECWEWCEDQKWLERIDFGVLSSQIGKVKIHNKQSIYE